MPEHFYQITAIMPGNLSSRAFDFLTDLEFPNQISASATRIDNPDTGNWRMMWLLDKPFSASEIIIYIHNMAAALDVTDLPVLDQKDLMIVELPDCNWLEHSYAGFQPFTIGRFHLRGRHDEKVLVPSGFTPIIIDAVTAFGSGEHPTTKGCLMLLDNLARAGVDLNRILDLGTGSGILAIAAHKLWPSAQITAVDNDPESVRVAAEYAGYNHVPVGSGFGKMACLFADTPTDPDVIIQGPFDLTIANILAGPLQDLAPAIGHTLTPNGSLILSGLLENQIGDVMAAYTPLGFQISVQHIMTDWVALLLTR